MYRAIPSADLIALARQSPCWLAQFQPTACQGEVQLCHLIKQQRLRDYHVPEEAIWDQRVLVPGCERHHNALDKTRTLRVPRVALPPEVEEYAAEHQLLWSLDRDYGEL